MKIIILALLLLTATSSFRIKRKSTQPSNGNYQLSMFYCGFGQYFCGQSTTNDVNMASTNIIMAFANTNADGTIIVD